MAYCDSSDLVLGGIPMPAETTATTYVNAAADEIDSYLAGLYVTPITVPMIPDSVPPAPVDPRHRQTTLTLKRINSHLASGRLITALASGGEDDQVHAYGLMLIREALAALNQLKTGIPDLQGVVKHEIANEASLRGAVYNVDPTSQVEDFYGMAAPGGIMLPESVV